MTEQTSLPELVSSPVCGVERPSRPGELAAFLTAVQFLTRVTIPFSPSASAAALSRCPVYFPLVGGLIGIVTCAALGFGCLFWPVWLAVLVALAVEVRLTGALHEDAVADFCDAFGGGWSRDAVLQILRDSRIGTYGALGLGLAVALRAGATISIIEQLGRQNWVLWSSAVLASCVLGRFVMVVAMFCLPAIPARESLSRDMGGQIDIRALLTASCWMLLGVSPLIVQLPIHALVCVSALVPFVRWFIALVRRRLGGMTGDCLGCLCYCTMVIVLLVCAARWNP